MAQVKSASGLSKWARAGASGKAAIDSFDQKGHLDRLVAATQKLSKPDAYAAHHPDAKKSAIPDREAKMAAVTSADAHAASKNAKTDVDHLKAGSLHKTAADFHKSVAGMYAAAGDSKKAADHKAIADKHYEKHADERARDEQGRFASK